jgi:hypothetical protein
VPMQEHPKIGRHVTGDQVEEHVAPAAVALHADRELVRKVPDGVVVAFTEDETRVLVLLQAVLQQADDEVELPSFSTALLRSQLHGRLGERAAGLPRRRALPVCVRGRSRPLLLAAAATRRCRSRPYAIHDIRASSSRRKRAHVLHGRLRPSVSTMDSWRSPQTQSPVGSRPSTVIARVVASRLRKRAFERGQKIDRRRRTPRHDGVQGLPEERLPRRTLDRRKFPTEDRTV